MERKFQYGSYLALYARTRARVGLGKKTKEGNPSVYRIDVASVESLEVKVEDMELGLWNLARCDVTLIGEKQEIIEYIKRADDLLQKYVRDRDEVKKQLENKPVSTQSL
jgi:hypothetical protein